MKAAVIVFPGSNCDRDLAEGFRRAGAAVTMVWHKDTDLPARTDVVGLPGGFSYGDYLRCGAIAARSPICRAVVDFAGRGGYVLGICNGFQILTETGLLPGVLMLNAGLKFICKTVEIKVENCATAFTSGYRRRPLISVPVAHHEGNYSADDATLDRLDGDGRVAFRYADNPNGAARDIAAILSENARVLGMMPHPERVVDPALGGTDGQPLFASLVGQMASA